MRIGRPSKAPLLESTSEFGKAPRGRRGTWELFSATPGWAPWQPQDYAPGPGVFPRRAATPPRGLWQGGLGGVPSREAGRPVRRGPVTQGYVSSTVPTREFRSDASVSDPCAWPDASDCRRLGRRSLGAFRHPGPLSPCRFGHQVSRLSLLTTAVRRRAGHCQHAPSGEWPVLGDAAACTAQGGSYHDAQLSPFTRNLRGYAAQNVLGFQ